MPAVISAVRDCLPFLVALSALAMFLGGCSQTRFVYRWFLTAQWIGILCCVGSLLVLGFFEQPLFALVLLGAVAMIWFSRDADYRWRTDLLEIAMERLRRRVSAGGIIVQDQNRMTILEERYEAFVKKATPDDRELCILESRAENLRQSWQKIGYGSSEVGVSRM